MRDLKMVLNKKMINDWKKNQPKKFLRLKYILYYFPFLRNDRERMEKLIFFLANDKDNFYILCKKNQIMPFFKYIPCVNVTKRELNQVNIQSFFDYFKI